MDQPQSHILISHSKGLATVSPIFIFGFMESLFEQQLCYIFFFFERKISREREDRDRPKKWILQSLAWQINHKITYWSMSDPWTSISGKSSTAWGRPHEVFVVGIQCASCRQLLHRRVSSLPSFIACCLDNFQKGPSDFSLLGTADYQILNFF